MADITPQMVKELREMTGAGMGDCKKALVEAEGDPKKAIEILRKKGAASASARAGRVANEGLIYTKTSPDLKKSIIIEINCETDFVSRNEEFIKYFTLLRDAYFDNNVNTVEDLLKLKVGNDTLESLHNEILAKFGEKIQIRRMGKLTVDNGWIDEYMHTGNKLAVLAVFEGASDPTPLAKSLAHDITMQIAAMNPKFVDRSEVNSATLENEKKLYAQQAIDEGKKPEIAEKIAQGKLEKYFSEFCLLEQSFVKDSNKVVGDVLKEISKEMGKDLKIKVFYRYFLGESEDNI
ncbi:MAG: translation elongation factor Ts [Chloroherpetonaceae bacterium]|nr:translation elongation factor Ts [bacterium]